MTLPHLQADVARPVSVAVPASAAVSFAGRRTWMPRFFFLTGGHKCGTSWLSWMVDTHPEVVCRSAGRFLGAPNASESWLHRAKFREWAQFHTVKEAWTGGVRFPEVEAAATRAIIEAMMMLRTPVGTRAVGDKTPMFYLREAPRLRELFPDATLIAIIRDGRDACVSHAFHMLRREEVKWWADAEVYARARAWHIEGKGEPVPLFTPELLRYAADNWRTTAEGSLAARETFGRDYLELRYEDLLADPAPGLRAVFEALGVDASDGVIDRCVAENSFEAKSGGRQPGEADPDSFVRKGVAGDWQNHFTPADRVLFHEVAGAALAGLGYESGDDWVAEAEGA